MASTFVRKSLRVQVSCGRLHSVQEAQNMSTAVVEGNLLTTDYVLSGILPFPLPPVESGLRLGFDIPAFQLQLTVPITEVESDMESGHVTFTGTISNDATLMLTVTGKLNREEDNFEIEQANIN